MSNIVKFAPKITERNTVKEVLDEVSNQLDRVETVVVFVMDKDGAWAIDHSNLSNITFLIGALERAKNHLLNNLD